MRHLALLVARATQLLDHLYAHARDYGLPPTEGRARGADEAQRPAPTMTKAIDRLERAQLVERVTPDDDRCRSLVFLTSPRCCGGAPVGTVRP